MKKKEIIIPMALILVVLVIFGFSYAIFSAIVVEDNKTETKMKSNELGLIYTGVTDINVQDIIPGDFVTKTFKVENTSNREVEYNIYLENIINEFNEDLVYTLSDQNGVVIEETPLPVSKDAKTYLKDGVTIGFEETKNYTLTIKFLYKEDEEQNAMQGASFNATLGIDTKKYTTDYSLMAYAYDNTNLLTSGEFVFYSNEQKVNAQSDGKIEVDNLEDGMHEVYYLKNIDTTNMSKQEIIENAICSATFVIPQTGNLKMECNGTENIEIKKVDVYRPYDVNEKFNFEF